ncbi:MAG: bifunctional YncE family protein/alkaline phosphatase family protein [Sphingobacteriales bacterium]|nr:bifunctional YncE family protein/alkaline phosphatase family protein [Sphingobacteriales bacterium]
MVENKKKIFSYIKNNLLAVSKSKKLIAVTNNGQSVQSIQLINPFTEKMLDKVVIPKSWYGLKFSADEKYLYASGGNDNWILKYAIINNKLKLTDSIKLGDRWPNKISPAGIEIDDAAKRMYVVTKENNSLYIVDLATKKIIQQISLGAESYACLLSPDKKELYVSLWGGDKVLIYDVKRQAIKEEVGVGDNPNELLLSKTGKYLYVANANDNSVSVIDIKQRKVLEVLNTALYPDAPIGSAANGLALSANEKTLYIANADNNSLAVFDVSIPGKSHSKGFIPVGWYPTNVEVVNKKIFVANGKGFQSFANPNGPNPVGKKQKVKFQQADNEDEEGTQYIGGLMKGTMSIIDEPNEKTLAAYSKTVYKNTPYTKEKELNAEGVKGNPIPMKVGDPSPIKYVFYIIKENRTYDQVLGDIPEGNGDTSLVLFGEKITPNQHKLARDYVLLDNFYVDAEVSADGHNWSMAANSVDYLEKTWPTDYGGRGGSYDAEGNRAIANPPKGFIWDHCKRSGVTYRTYGEFADDYKANIPVLENHFCPYYTSWDQRVRDTTRANQWKRDFDSLVAANALPRLSTLRIINDHTEGLSIGRPTPFAHVADNDWGVGMFIDYLSHSSVWKESVVFILEDDAQNGPDHVDAHRSPAYVVGPYVKRKFVDHTMYSTSSMLRTMELILGMPPMSQYDAAATPMWRCFTSTPDFTSYTSIPAQIDITEVNTKHTTSAKLSATFDFSKEDRVPDLLFSEVIWKAVKGENSKMPAPRRSAFVKLVDNDKDDDD